VLNHYIKNNSSQNAKNKIIILNPPKIKNKPSIVANPQQEKELLFETIVIQQHLPKNQLKPLIRPHSSWKMNVFRRIIDENLQNKEFFSIEIQTRNLVTNSFNLVIFLISKENIFQKSKDFNALFL
jgi:hypothetical protein